MERVKKPILSQMNLKKKYIYDICKCGKPKETKNRPYCRECCKEFYRKSKEYKLEKSKSLENNTEEILTFIKLIESRGGFISINEIFVNLITYYNQIENNSEQIDSLSVKDQILIMWNELRKWRETQTQPKNNE
jgi:hypothetical protein